MERINFVLQQLLDERKKQNRDFTSEESQLLSHLLSQLKELQQKESDGDIRDVEGDDPRQNHNTNESDPETESILEELKKIRRQNVITHCLLAVLTVVTGIWQLSEISIVLSLKDKVSHPFRAIGGLFSGLILGGEKEKDRDKFSLPPIVDQVELPQLPPVGVPSLPTLNGTGGEETKVDR